MPAINADSPLRRQRQRRGLTLAVLADRAGLSVSFLSMVENGQRKLSRRDHVNVLALALGVAPCEDAAAWRPGRRRGSRGRPALFYAGVGRTTGGGHDR